MSLTIEQALKQGVAAHKEGKLEEAERLYRAVLQSHPAHPDANHNLGVLAVSINKADAALPLFKLALEANPKKEQFWLSYIDVLIAERQFENAEQALKDGEEKGVAQGKLQALTQKLESVKAGNNSIQAPSQAEIQKLLTHYQNGRYDDAEQLALLITQEFPENQFGWKVMGALLQKTGMKSEALNANQRAVQLLPQDAEAHNNLGTSLKELGRLEEAEASYRQAIALKSDYAKAYNNLGTSLKELGRLGAAEASYKQAIALKSGYAEAYYNLGATLKVLGRLDEAEATYRQAIALKPEFAESHNNLGNTLQQLGRLDEAEASYRQAISLKPDFAEVHNNLGTTLKELGRLDEAEASYGQAIALMPSFTNALKNRWQLLYDKKQYETALRDADLCISKGARELDLTTLYALGRIEEIYKRIEIRSKSDGENISIAAFAAFVAESEKKRTAYNFCPNPIDFIHFSNLSSHLKDSPAYITELIEELDKIETIWEPSGKSTNTGFQTLLGMNLFKDPSGKIAQLKSIIIDELDTYYLKFHNESCSYIQKWPSIYDLFGWHVILKQQGYQSGHIHTGGWLSAVVYLNVVPSLGKDEGAIRFSLNGVHYTDVNSPELTFQPELGDIVFFPSSLHHRTIPFKADMDRISIAFDLAPGASRH